MLEEIIRMNEDKRDLAEHVGITLTLEQYDYLIAQAKLTDMAMKLSNYHQQKRKEAEDLNEVIRWDRGKLSK